VEEDNYVICLDNFYTGNKSNISKLEGKKNFEVLVHDVTIPIKIEVDEIYNLACPASPIHYQKNPVQTTKTIVYGAINMLELAVQTGARVLQASTSEVYGDPEVHPQTEEYWGHVNPIGPRSCYDEGKRCAETLFSDFHHQLDVDIKIARIFNTYGPQMNRDDGRVISNFIVQALMNKDITVYGDGGQTRSFCYIDDLIRGITLLMNSEAAVIGPINLGNPKESTMLEIANHIIGLTDSKSRITNLTLPPDDPRQRQPDISLANKVLKWSPTIGLDEGLRKTISYFTKILK
jgi:UDP-glucuronate decarboxylase